MAYDFKGRTVVVTGAGAGIGKAIAQKLAECGAKVVGLSLVKEEVESLAREIPGINAIQADVTDWNGVKKVLEKLGPIHGLVNNAGVAITAPFLDVTEDQVDKTIAVNLKGIITVSQAVAKNMIANNIKGGSIVNISSIAALTGLPSGSIYCASKGAVHALSRTMAVELGRQGIRVNTINPTVVKTELSRFLWEPEEVSTVVSGRTPLGRFAERREVADAVTFLLSDQAAMINGIALPVDGGYLAA